jgi:hypothetical protein
MAKTLCKILGVVLRRAIPRADSELRELRAR